MIDREKLKAYCEGFGVLLSRNSWISLTVTAVCCWSGIKNESDRDPGTGGGLIKHFVDSLALLGFAELPQGAKLIDVGTGAGFPGLPLKIARPDLRLALWTA